MSTMSPPVADWSSVPSSHHGFMGQFAARPSQATNLAYPYGSNAHLGDGSHMHGYGPSYVPTFEAAGALHGAPRLSTTSSGLGSPIDYAASTDRSSTYSLSSLNSALAGGHVNIDRQLPVPHTGGGSLSGVQHVDRVAPQSSETQEPLAWGSDPLSHLPEKRTSGTKAAADVRRTSAASIASRDSRRSNSSARSPTSSLASLHHTSNHSLGPKQPTQIDASQHYVLPSIPTSSSYASLNTLDSCGRRQSTRTSPYNYSQFSNRPNAYHSTPDLSVQGANPLEPLI